jgi:hypothetical protein
MIDSSMAYFLLYTWPLAKNKHCPKHYGGDRFITREDIMQFQVEIDIHSPRNHVIELFLNPDKLYKWQPDLIRFEPLNGVTKREVGAKSRQVHNMGGRKVDIVETITVCEYPDKYAATYEADGVWSLVTNRFIAIDDNKTKWIVDAEFKCSGFVKMMLFVMPGIFRKQTLTFMQRFKTFVEHSRD